MARTVHQSLQAFLSYCNGCRTFGPTSFEIDPSGAERFHEFCTSVPCSSIKSRHAIFSPTIHIGTLFKKMLNSGPEVSFSCQMKRCTNVPRLGMDVCPLSKKRLCFLFRERYDGIVKSGESTVFGSFYKCAPL